MSRDVTHFVRYNEISMFISIDLGGTNTRVAASRDLAKILEEKKCSTIQDLKPEVDLIVSTIKDISQGEEVEGICIGVPGLVNKKSRKLGEIVNIHALSDLSFSELVGGEFPDETLVVENDAALAGLAEAAVGAGYEHDVVAYLTLSTGVGGVRIAGKQIDPYSKHSEPGHMIIRESDRVFKMCGQKGCLSSFVSGTGFEEVFEQSPIDCDDQQIWDEYAKYLASGITNVVAMWAPDIVVLGGSMTNKFEFFEKPLQEELKKDSLFDIPPIVKAELGDNSGIIGGFVQLADLLE